MWVFMKWSSLCYYQLAAFVGGATVAIIGTKFLEAYEEAKEAGAVA